MGNNLEFWDSVEKTNPKHTKKVNGAGRSLTAINAQQQIKNATEKWGMYGETWGLKDVELDYINNLSNNQILAVAQAMFFYPKGEFDIGSSILVQSYIQAKEYNGNKRPAYNKVDDDFLKKLETDMTTKALSKLGFNADVFLGKYDDNKYVTALQQEFNKVEKPKEVITEKDYNMLKLPKNHKHINWYLDNREMSDDQRKGLEKLKEIV